MLRQSRQIKQFLQKPLVLMSGKKSVDVQKESVEEKSVQSKGKEQSRYRKGMEKVEYLEQHARVEYKDYPLHIKHNDPKHPDYIACEQSDIQAHNTHKAYNEMIHNLKLDLQMQQLVYHSLERLDRPYLRREGVKGITINRFTEVKDYGQVQQGVYQAPEDIDEYTLREGMRNENRWVDNAVFELKDKHAFTHYQEYLAELDARPVDSHFNSHKGYKYDVPVAYEDRVPYMADRLGHPELMGTPMERLLRLEGTLYHPEYIDQPFVQAPSPHVDSNLDFEEGEVLYENYNVQEWAKFWKGSVLMTYLSICYFVPLNYLFFAHTPLELALSKSYLQPHDVSFYYFDKLGLHIPMLGAFAYYSSHILLKLQHDMMKDYVVKMQYSRDKELLFVTRVSYWGGVEEEVHEMHHVEMLPPCTKSGLAQLSAQDPDGLYEFYNMNGKNSLVCYKEDHYWNPQLKADFIKSISSLWGKDSVVQTRAQNKQAMASKVSWAMSFANTHNHKQIS